MCTIASKSVMIQCAQGYLRVRHAKPCLVLWVPLTAYDDGYGNGGIHVARRLNKVGQAVKLAFVCILWPFQVQTTDVRSIEHNRQCDCPLFSPAVVRDAFQITKVRLRYGRMQTRIGMHRYTWGRRHYALSNIVRGE